MRSFPRLPGVLGTATLALAVLALDKYATPREDVYGGSRTVGFLLALTGLVGLAAICSLPYCRSALQAILRWSIGQLLRPRTFSMGRFHLIYDGYPKDSPVERVSVPVVRQKGLRSRERALGGTMARKVIQVCDKCGKEVEEGKGAVLRVTFNDARRGAKAADLCDNCAGTMPGNAVARRGRKPKAVAA